MIKGFKSYKNESKTDPLSEHCNVVVGRNGSGKSNFFTAVRFVLGDVLSTTHRDERAKLIHEGSGSSVMSAYVEIVLDNSDKRIPHYGQEVVIRRTIGLKKDDFSIDRKHADKSEIRALLESAGFSRTNPYYIVPQGKVVDLTNAKDSQRLGLLKDVAGTQTYEDRRKKSLEMMQETLYKQQRIDENLNFIEERLQELEDEKRELKDYQEKDKEKRCIDYTIQQNEISELESKYESFEDENINYSEHIQQMFNERDVREDQYRKLDAELMKIKEQIEIVEVDKSQANKDLEQYIQKFTQLKMEVDESEGKASDNQKSKERRANDLNDIESAIASQTSQLEGISPQYDELKAKEDDLKSKYSSASSRLEHLRLKQGRGSSFKSKKEYEKWINNEIDSLKTTLKERDEAVASTKSELEQVQQEEAKLKSEISELRDKSTNERTSYREIRQQHVQAKDKVAELQDQRRSLWRDESRKEIQLNNSKDMVKKFERQLYHTMDRATSTGLENIKKIVEDQNIEGVYGTLAELISFDEKYKLAMEITAGASLFHIVVDTDETATKLLQQLNKTSGRATFIPLNRINPTRPEYPQNEDEVVPLMNYIKCDSRFTKAVEQVFGKTVLAINLDTARNVEHTTKLNAITLLGDKIDKGGTVTGGYHDSRKSRIDATRNVQTARDELSEAEREMKELQSKLNNIRQEINKVGDDEARLSAQIIKADTELSSLNSSLSSSEDQLRQLQTSIEELKQGIASSTSLRQDVANKLESYKKDLAAGFSNTLTEEETLELEHLQSSVAESKKSISETMNKRIELEEQKKSIESELSENLYPRRQRLLTESDEFEDDNYDDTRISSLRAQIDRYGSLVEETREKLKNLEAEEERLSDETLRLNDGMNKLSDEMKQAETAAKESQKKLSELSAKRGELKKRKQECESKMRGLGTLVLSSYEYYKDRPTSQLLKKSAELGEELKKFSHVNKKALEQHSNFTRQREDLTERRDELYESERSIKELIENLDQRKDEAIDRTFKQVAKYFSEVFQKIVPAGTGRLVMLRKTDADAAAPSTQQEDSQLRVSDDEDDDPAVAMAARRARDATSRVENYIGVSIRVSFNSKRDEQQRLEQLSGGQKSLCALALIFAIQKSDPAPFYLLDEVDANLDTQYRTAVAEMIKELSSDGQFVCTTFRPELLSVADKFFGVTFNNKMSSIDTITQDDALRFVQESQAH